MQSNEESFTTRKLLHIKRNVCKEKESYFSMKKIQIKSDGSEMETGEWKR